MHLRFNFLNSPEEDVIITFLAGQATCLELQTYMVRSGLNPGPASICSECYAASCTRLGVPTSKHLPAPWKDKENPSIQRGASPTGCTLAVSVGLAEFPREIKIRYRRPGGAEGSWRLFKLSSHRRDRASRRSGRLAKDTGQLGLRPNFQPSIRFKLRVSSHLEGTHTSTMQSEYQGLC